MSTNYIINISKLEVTSNTEILKAITSALQSCENTAFKVAVRIAYLTGKTIPCGDSKLHIAKERKMTQKQVCDAVKRSQATISRWSKALNYIIDNDLFNDFNNGKYPFSFDKIIIIFSNKDDWNGATFDTLMDESVAQLEARFKGEAEAEAEATSEAEAEGTAEAEAEAEDNSPIVKFSYNGFNYTCHESALMSFISTYCDIDIELK